MLRPRLIADYALQVDTVWEYPTLPCYHDSTVNLPFLPHARQQRVMKISPMRPSIYCNGNVICGVWRGRWFDVVDQISLRLNEQHNTRSIIARLHERCKLGGFETVAFHLKTGCPSLHMHRIMPSTMDSIKFRKFDFPMWRDAIRNLVLGIGKKLAESNMLVIPSLNISLARYHKQIDCCIISRGRWPQRWSNREDND